MKKQNNNNDDLKKNHSSTFKIKILTDLTLMLAGTVDWCRKLQ